MIPIRLIGPERALGDSAVGRQDDGSVLLTNPFGMFLLSVPFLVLALALAVSAFKCVPGRRHRGELPNLFED